MPRHYHRPIFEPPRRERSPSSSRRHLSGVLARAHGNVTAAAQMAGKERRAFGKLLKKYGIDKSRYQS